MAGIDLEIDHLEDNSNEDLLVDEDIVDDKPNKRRNTKQQFKVRRAIEDYLNDKRFRQEVDYLSDLDFDEEK